MRGARASTTGTRTRMRTSMHHHEDGGGGGAGSPILAGFVGFGYKPEPGLIRLVCGTPRPEGA